MSCLIFFINILVNVQIVELSILPYAYDFNVDTWFSFHPEVSHLVFSDMGQWLDKTYKKKYRVLVIFLQFCSGNKLFSHSLFSAFIFSAMYFICVYFFFFPWFSLSNFNLPLLLISEFCQFESTKKSSPFTAFLAVHFQHLLCVYVTITFLLTLLLHEFIYFEIQMYDMLMFT